ncbi:hypothetical protein PINS_up000587 [Pythium insidiosum]|nr:hypothetical protein PINS_up000587 [Pythium insidiosum]
MVLGLLLREHEERQLSFDFEMLLPDDVDMSHDDDASTGPGGKKDFKRGTVVCRHWLRGLCMKGDNCEFLHQFDMARMPECRWGMECQVPECPFRHVPDEERVECAFYRQGFCSHGPNCRYRHVKLAREECPETADFSLQSKVAEEENIKRRKAQPVNEFYKIAICKHWEKLGTCPFGEDCHFAHGEKELRPFPRGERDGRHPGASGHGGGGAGGGAGGGGGGAPHNNGPSMHAGGPPPMAMPATPAGPPAVVLPDENKFCKYFVLHSFRYLNLAHGVHHNVWSVPRELQQTLKLASETCDDVFLFITVSPSKHVQAVARLVPGALLHAGADSGEDLSAGVIPFEQSESQRSWRGAFGVEWLRICECPWDRLAQLDGKPGIDVAECSNGHEVEADAGHAAMRLLFDQPPIQLHYRSVEDEEKLPGGSEELATRRREAAASLLSNIPNGPPKRQFTTPGFVFACTNSTIDECFGRMLFGLAKEQESVAQQHVSPGTPLFLLNLSDRHLLGVFEALSPAVPNLVPGAFLAADGSGSQYPIQVQFAIAIPAPAINSVEPAVKAIAGGDRGIRVGPLSLDVTQRLADLFAERGAAPMFAPPGGHGPPPQAGPSPMQAATGSSNAEPSFRRSHSGASSGGRDASGAFLEKMLVGIEPDSEFGVTRRIIGPGGSHMKRISQEAGGGAKIKVRGRGSGSKESTEDEANEPLMIIVSAENDRSFRIACDLTSQLLSNIHRDHQVFLQRQQQRGGHRGGPPPPRRGGGGGGQYGGPPPPFGGFGMPPRGPPPPMMMMHRGGGGGGGPPSMPPHGQQQQ